MSNKEQQKFEVQSSLATKIDYQDKLNKQQLEAVKTEGPALVIAGAGTGKTRVLIHRVAYLIEKGIDPPKILLLTFTKKAATEMMNRVSALLKSKTGGSIAGGTFHSFANLLLRRYANLLKIPVNFTILDNADSEDVIDKIRADLGFNKSEKAFPKKNRLFEIISSARNRQLSIKAIINSDFSGLKQIRPEIERIVTGYTSYKKEHALFDFDDLMEYLAEALKTNELFRQLVKRKYSYVMVDEYQDTNLIQNEIVRLLAPKGNNVMVVGDDMQSIYSFRGANHNNIVQFPNMFVNCKTIVLEQNYRSQPDLLDFTNETIENAPVGFRKKLWSDKVPNGKPVVAQFYDPEDEAEYIVTEILELHEKGIGLENLAVLTRTSWNSIQVQFELEKRGIPYVVVGGVKFAERKHVKDILAYLRVMQNPKDSVAWYRLLKLLPGVGIKTAEKVVAGDSVKNVRVSELKRLIVMVSADEISLAVKLEQVALHYYPILESLDPDAEIRKKDIELIIQRSASYESIEKFLSDFTLDPPSKKLAKQVDPLVDENEEKPLTVSTIHSAKGLEWHTVFVAHVLDGVIPSVKAIEDDEIEEERRLFYVACTRAKENLYITYPSFLPLYDGFLNQPSRFINEINKLKYLQNES